MTEEELEKEAEEWLCNNLHSASEEDFIKAMIDIAEPREKRIAELEARCNELFLQTCEQAEKIKELIKNLMVYVPVDLKEYEEAKQFLNSKIEK